VPVKTQAEVSNFKRIEESTTDRITKDECKNIYVEINIQDIRKDMSKKCKVLFIRLLVDTLSFHYSITWTISISFICVANMDLPCIFSYFGLIASYYMDDTW
jgi:hypothetical protein